MDIRQKKVLVTGSEGMLGKCLVEELKKEGCNIIPFDKAHGNITDWNSVKGIGKVDMVCHLAAIPSVAYSFERPHEVMRINAVGTLNMLEFARQQGIKKFVFISSYLYGNPNYLPVDEAHPLQPGNPYAYSKLIAEKFCESYHQSYNLPIVVFRPFNIYGPNQKEMIIPAILGQINSEKIVLKDLEPKRDYVYISDVVSAIIAGLKADIGGYEIFNIGTGKSRSVKELAELVLKIVGRDIPLVDLKQRRPNEVMDCIADISKARNLLGWVPKISMEEGLSKVLSQL